MDLRNNKLEIEGYPNSYLILQHIPTNRKECVEITKIAVKQEYREQGVIKKLLLSVFEYCENNKLSALINTHHNYLKTLFQKIEFPLLIEQAFKYEDHDPYPVNFYFASYKKQEVNAIKKNLEYLENDLTSNAFKIFRALEIVAPMVPNPFYWMDANGVVLGINEACLKAIGTTRDIIGKKPYDFYKKEIADHILQHNTQVIRSGEVSSQEEPFEDITTKQVKYFLSVKAPLYDDNGAIIGIVGSSTDITAEKEAEKLRIKSEKLEFENKAQELVVEEQTKYKRTVDQMVHDVGTPLHSLNMLLKSCTGIEEQYRVDMREAVMRIDGITRSVLNQYKASTEGDHKGQDEQAEALLLASTLMQSISEKKHQYHDKEVKFTYEFSPESQFAFIKMQPNALKRMVSNIMNNAVDAFEGKPGAVTLKLDASETWTKIEIEDNGKGMPKEIIQKIMQNIAVTEGKADGHGIGMGQVKDTLANNNGKMQISSEIGKGTKITLTFPRIEAPYWIADEIILFPTTTVLVLDDDSSIHGAWEKHFKIVAPNIPLEHFTVATDLLDYVKKLSPEQKENIFLLTDYELLGQNLNGLDVIAETGIEDSILVTSHYNNEKVRALAAKTRTKILPKSLASEMPIKVMAETETEKVDVVMIEDNDLLAKSTVACYNKHQRMVYFLNPFDFLKDVQKFPKKYPKDTKITLDNDFGSGVDINGFEMAKKLHEMGFTQLYLLSGYPFDPEAFENFPYLTLIMKGDDAGFEEKLNIKSNF